MNEKEDKYIFGTLKPPKWDLRKIRIKEKELR
jgi:hypothetical protein